MTVFIHIANVLYLVSYLVRDILWLRCVTVIAILTLMPYFYFQPDILWAAIAWNTLFLGINGYQIYRLLLERRPVTLSEDEQKLYRCCFPSLPPRQFKLLASAATCREIGEEQLITEGDRLTEVMVVFRGELCVERNGQTVAELGPGNLIGEMSYLSGGTAAGHVRSLCSGTVYSWSHDALNQLFARSPELRGQWQKLVIDDLSKKLKR